MARARAIFAAVPQRVWTAVAGLALLASLAIAAVIGAGLSLWRSAVGSSAEPPVAAIEPPGSGIVVLPGGHAPRVPSPLKHTPTARTGSVPAPAVFAPATRPLTAAGAATVTAPVAAPPVTSVSFTPQLLAAGNGNGVGLVSARTEQLVEDQPATHREAAEHAEHARHEAALAQREATRHHAKHEARHAKAGRKHHAKHGGHRHGR